MRQRGLLLLRFWVFLAIAIVAGVLVFGLVMSAGAWLGSVLPSLAFTIAQFLYTVAALIIAITIGSVVWNLLYRVSGIAPFQEQERLKLDHGQDTAAAKNPNAPRISRRTSGRCGNLSSRERTPSSASGSCSPEAAQRASTRPAPCARFGNF
jgi:hypothetical protein